MKKRLWSFAVMAGLIFALGTSAFADTGWYIEDVFDSGGLTSVTVTQSVNSINENTDETYIADVELKFNNGGSVKTPTVTFDSGSMPYSWEAEEGYTLTNGNMTLVGVGEEGNDDETSVDYYNFKLKLYVGAGANSAGNYTGTIGYTGNTNTGTFTLTVNENATAPVFETEASLDLTLGSKTSVQIELSNYENSAVTWAIDDAGETALNALNLTFKTSDGTIDRKDTSTGIDYGTSGSATFTVTATATKNPKPATSKTFTITITGAVSAVFSSDIPTAADLGKAYDTEGGQGLYLDDTIKQGDELFTFTAYGTLPLNFSYTELPNGLEFTTDTDEGTPEVTSGNTPKTKNGYRTAYISGTPDTAKEYSFTITVSNNVLPEGVTKSYKITTLETPTLEGDETKEVTWGKEIEDKTTFTAENFVGGTSEITWAIDEDYSELTAANLTALGLTFNTSNGEISGTWAGNGTSGGLLNFGNKSELTKNLVITATKYGKTATANLTLIFEMTPPVVDIPEMTFTYSDDSITKTITASGAGTITWAEFPADLTALGLESYTSFDADGAATMTVYGKPNYTLHPAKEYAFTATNAAGTSEKGAANVEIKTTFVELMFDESELPSGDYALNSTFGPITISAKPGPVTFTFVPDLQGKTKTNFEQAWTPTIVSVDGNNGEKSIISGTFSKPTGIYTFAKNVASLKTRKDITYKIVATNTDYGVTESTNSRYLYVHDVPQITTKNDKEWKWATDKVLKQAIATNIDVTSWDMFVSYDGSEGWTQLDTGKVSVSYVDSDYGSSEGSSYLTITADPKKPTAANITGSIDRVPAGGKLQIRVVAIAQGGTSSLDFPVGVTGVAPKLGKVDVKNAVPAGTDTWSWDIPATGTKPLFMKAYIAAKDAQKVFGVNKDIYIGGYTWLGKEEEEDEESSIETGFSFELDPETGHGTLYFDRDGDGEGFAYKGLPVTIQMVNPANYAATFTADKKKATTGSVKPSVTANKNPSWYVWSSDAEAYIDVKSIDLKSALTYNETAGKAFSGYKFLVKGDGPIVVTLPTKFPTGLTVTSSDAYDDDYAGYTADGRIYEISGTPDSTKESKNKISFTAKNNSTGGSGKADVTIIGMTIPKITAKAQEKTILVGGKLSLKGAASGTKNITWEILGTEYSADATTDIAQYGLSLDKVKGTLATVATGAAKVTVNENDEYKPINVYLAARNDAGVTNDPAGNPALRLTVGIAGAKAAFGTKQIELYRGVEGFGLSDENALLKTNAENDKANVTYEIEKDAKNKNADALAALGLSTEIIRVDSTGTASATGNYGRLQLADGVTDLIANKGASVKFNASNYGTAIAGSVKIIVYDPKPVINAVDTLSGTASTGEVVNLTGEGGITLSLTETTAPTGDSKVTWKIATKPSDKNITASLKADKNDTSKANLVVSVKKVKAGTITAAIEDSFKVTATTSSIKDKEKNTGEVTINVIVNPPADEAAPEDDAEAPEEEAVPETETETEAEVETEPEAEVEEEPEETTGTLTFGEARTVDSLTADQKAFIEASGYKVVAVLPAVKAAEDGLHDISNVELVEDAPVGAELVYFPFPAETEEGEEEGSTLFYDETGDITDVPEGKVVTVSTWFYADKVYTPVVAVKVGNASDTMNTVEEVRENAADDTTEAEVIPETKAEEEAPATVEE